jgi:hypothetical protein
MLATPHPHILYPNIIEQECALFSFYMSNNIVDGVINRSAGWWGGSIFSVRNSFDSDTYTTNVILIFKIGQIAGLSSTEFGLANMILAAVSVGTVRAFYVIELRIFDLLK